MSCQQASRFITTTSIANTGINIPQSISNNLTRVVNAEDPYVFTESVPTTPPILFNTQKSRSRLSDTVSVPTSISFGNVPQQRVSLTNRKIAEIISQTNPATKNVITQSVTTTAGTTQNKKATNVCIVRPQLQQQQQQQQQQQHVISSTPCLERELKSISPPPLYTPTPSLWQTPLLIESAPTKPTPTPATSITPLPPTPTLGVTLGGNVCALPPGGCSSPSTALASTTAMAKVAPIVVHSASPLSPPASCLPPSKFHSHTMAQHLQKVECLKKPKKSVQPLSQFCSDDLVRAESADKTFLKSLDTEQNLKSVKSSPNEAVNDIPVNVIFRMALVPQSHQPQMDLNHTMSKNETFLTPAVKNHSTVSSPSPSLSLPCQAKSNGNRDVSVTTTAPASKINHIARTQHEINPSSMQQHSQHQQIHFNSNQYETPVQKCMPKEEDQSAPQPLRKTKVTNSKPRKPTNTKSILSNFQPPDHSTVDCSTPKGSVAVVKMSHRITEASERDISYLATPAGLPYCVQNHWFTSYDIRNRLVAGEKGKLNRSLLREERITLYKQQLRSQAMQLLSTRSLQRLPLQLARKRLVCVDRLLRKYKKQTKIGLPPANVKRCIAKECKAFSLEMASYCQQHIALNTTQAIFLECTAKFADNTQCRVPVFDIRHDLPLCLEHARKRDAYNRLSCEPKPRKSLASNAPVVASVSYCATMGRAIRVKQPCMPVGTKRVATGKPQAAGRKRKPTGNPVGRPQKRAKKCSEGNVASIVPCLTSAGLKRKNSTTSLESLTSNSQHSSTSSISHFTNPKQFNSVAPTSIRSTTSTSGINSLSPPALAPLSTGFMSQSLPRHLFSFGSDNNNINANVRKHSTATPNFSHTTEFKDLPSFGTQANAESTDANFINTNSNSNFTSSGMGSTTSIPSADDFLTQDMLSICENSSVSSVDTGLGGLSDPEFMLGAHDGDDIPLSDTHLLGEQDLASVLSSLPEDAFRELFSAVHPDESDEIERAIELADKHLKTLQQSIGTNDLLGDFLNFSDDMLLDHGDICSSAGSASSNQMIDPSSIYLTGGAVTNISTNGN